MSCVVCHRSSDCVVWEENGYQGRLCECGTVYTSPEPAAGVTDPRNDYHSDSFYSTYALFKAQWVWRQRPAGRLLEIGCGDGHFLHAARTLGYDVAGVEANPVRARGVRDWLGVEVRCSLLEDLEWHGASFDVVYHCDLLSHFADPVGALQKMSRLLAPGGMLIFEAGTLGGLNPSWYRRVGQLGFPQHRWLYSESSLRRLLEITGLDILRMQHFGLAPAVALHQWHVLAGRLLRVLRKKAWAVMDRPYRLGRATVGALREAQVRQHAASKDERPQFVGGPRKESNVIYDAIEQFFRYRIGRIAPRLGPATWLIAARPRQEIRI
jgi:SAM-dependent methyltransferase